MRELLPQLEDWLKDGERVAIATVISTWGSAPRPAGSYMAISESGGLVGSVSGGCVEGAVIQAAQQVIKDQKPQRLHFGVADETAWDVGLACGGRIDIFVQPADNKIFASLLPKLKADEDMALTTLIDGPEHQLGAQVLRDAAGSLIVSSANANGAAQIEHLAISPPIQKSGEAEYFVNPLPTSPTLIMIGGGHIAVALVALARTINFRTVVIDPRKTFATNDRFANADQLLQVWPQRAFENLPLTSTSAVALLSHDPKIDDPAILAALASPAFYIGALGSSRTNAARVERLKAAGLSERELARIHAPIGLEIGAEMPEEIALAIMAQVVKAYRG